MNEKLVNAVLAGNAAEVKKTLRHMEAVTRKIPGTDENSQDIWAQYTKVDPVNIDATHRYEADTALILAASRDYTEIARLLLEAKANANVPNQYGEMALHHAAFKGNEEITGLLLEAKASIDPQRARKLDTPLIMAAGQGHAAIIKLLLSHEPKPNLNLRDSNGWTALHWAAHGGFSEIVKLLLEAGAEINPPDKQHQTPYYWAMEKNHAEVVAVLQKANYKDQRKKWDAAKEFSNMPPDLWKIILSYDAFTEEEEFKLADLKGDKSEDQAVKSSKFLVPRQALEAKATFWSQYKAKANKARGEILGGILGLGSGVTAAFFAFFPLKRRIDIYMFECDWEQISQYNLDHPEDIQDLPNFEDYLNDPGSYIFPLIILMGAIFLTVMVMGMIGGKLLNPPEAPPQPMLHNVGN